MSPHYYCTRCDIVYMFLTHADGSGINCPLCHAPSPRIVHIDGYRIPKVRMPLPLPADTRRDVDFVSHYSQVCIRHERHRIPSSS